METSSVLPFDLGRPARHVADEFGGRADVDHLGEHQHLADVQRFELRQFVEVLLDQIGEPQQHALAVGGARVRPLAFERLARRLDRAVDVFAPSFGDARAHLFGGGIDDLEGFAGSRVHPFAADQKLALLLQERLGGFADALQCWYDVHGVLHQPSWQRRRQRRLMLAGLHSTRPTASGCFAHDERQACHLGRHSFRRRQSEELEPRPTQERRAPPFGRALQEHALGKAVPRRVVFGNSVPADVLDGDARLVAHRLRSARRPRFSGRGESSPAAMRTSAVRPAATR